MNLTELKKKSPSDLMTMASEMGIENIARARKQEVIFSILKSHAKNGEDIFKLREINKETGCLVVVRPDQHIANILPLKAFSEISEFFDQFMTKR